MSEPTKTTDPDVGFFGQRAVDEADDRAARMFSGLDTGSDALNAALDRLRNVYEANPTDLAKLGHRGRAVVVFGEAIIAVLDAAGRPPWERAP